ncbi:endo alpha-1,4 polygalactosaminidase [Parasalinivibrio latis]|uniref:endo alpha-1,4 polygalactosaminidase n=1 Tax=Parasalinivibrio latis TaxID=2952610 RepID=UPI0030DE41A5
MNLLKATCLGLVITLAGCHSAVNAQAPAQTPNTAPKQPETNQPESIPPMLAEVPPPIQDGDWYRPPVMATWQWQLQGSLDVDYAVDLYDIDLFDTSQATIQSLQQSGKRVICYFSAGTYEDWRSDASQFPLTALGNPLADWEGERWLDIRNQGIRPVLEKRLDLAVSKGCDGVEPDNVDAYSNPSGFPLTYQAQIDFNRWMANEAHERGLAVALKNSVGQVTDLVNYYDLAVNESCFRYNECDKLSPFIEQGKAVLHVEYPFRKLDTEDERTAFCQQMQDRQFSSMILNRKLNGKQRYSCL